EDHEGTRTGLVQETTLRVLRALRGFVINRALQAHARRLPLAPGSRRWAARRRRAEARHRDRSPESPGQARGLPRGRSTPRESDGTTPSPSARYAPSPHWPPRESARDRAAASARAAGPARGQPFGPARCASLQTLGRRSKSLPANTRTAAPTAPALDRADRPTRSPSPSPPPGTRRPVRRATT